MERALCDAVRLVSLLGISAAVCVMQRVSVVVMGCEEWGCYVVIGAGDGMLIHTVAKGVKMATYTSQGGRIKSMPV